MMSQETGDALEMLVSHTELTLACTTAPLSLKSVLPAVIVIISLAINSEVYMMI